MDTQVQPKILSLRDAGKFAGISESTIRRLIDRGDLTKVKMSVGRVGVDVDELRGYLAEAAEK